MPHAAANCGFSAVRSRRRLGQGRAVRPNSVPSDSAPGTGTLIAAIGMGTRARPRCLAAQPAASPAVPQWRLDRPGHCPDGHQRQWLASHHLCGTRCRQQVARCSISAGHHRLWQRDRQLGPTAEQHRVALNGGAGRLDHAIANTSMAAKVNRVTHWHINADEAAVTDYNTEFKTPALSCGAGGTSLCPADPFTATPYRSSDHDPVVVGLNLYNKAWTGTGGADVITAAAGADLVWASVGADLLTGGAGSNGFAYRSLREAGGTITDFVPGKDRIDLSALLASINTASSTALSRGVVRLVAASGHTWLQIDTDGNAGPVLPRTLVTLRNVLPAQIAPRRDLGLN